MRTMQIDFVRSSSQPLLGWVVLTAGLVMLSLTTWQYLEHQQRQESARQIFQQQVQLQAEEERQRVAALPALTPSYVDDKRWNRAARELALPWMETLRALEHSAKPPVFLLGFKSDPSNGRLQLDAEAPSFDAALDFVSALQANPALAQTQISSHEDAPDPQGRTLTRFSVQTQWVTTP